MPLLRKKAFEISSMPEYLRDDEEVFLCEVTNEIFRDYEEFCQRIILVNSMVWSCSMTGKTNLTYAEALASEQAARKSIQDFPYELRTPVLYLASKTRRTGFGEMADDIFSFIKDRYFVGEIVESSFTENNWRESHILQVIAPTEEQIQADAKKKVPERCSSPERNYYPPAQSFRYEVEHLDSEDQDSSQVMIVEASQVRRKKGPFSKEKCKLFLKQFVEQNDQGTWVLKESTRSKFNIDNIKFEQIFDGPLPDFDASKRLQKNMANGSNKKVRQETLAKYLKKSNYFGDENGKKLLNEMKRKEEEYKQRCAELKLKKQEEKILEKQKRREENIKVSSQVKEWYKPKEDLELEDQKKIPPATLVQTKIPAKYFGDALMILEFSESFSQLLNTRDFFPGGLTLDLIERALIEKEVAGPLTDIIQMLLTAIFSVQAEEAAEKRDSQADLNSEDMIENMSLSEATHLATVASGWSIKFQGMALNRLPLYPLTVSEVLRLHLLSSGARLSEAAAKWRYQQRGGYLSEDDPGLQLRVKYPHILRALAVHNVNQLPMGDKLKLLTCLVDQLLTYADTRDIIEERNEKLRQSKYELKSLQAAEKRREQEFISNKLKIKRELKGPENAQQSEIDLKKLETEANKKKAEFSKQCKDLTVQIADLQMMLGSDRSFKRYYISNFLSAIFVENDERNPGVCYNKIIEQKPELIDADHANTVTYVRKLMEETGSDKENDVTKNKPVNGISNSVKIKDDVDLTRELDMCTANDLPCPVHSSDGKPSWSFYHTPEQLNELTLSLNKRGIRESEMRQLLETIKIPLETSLGKCKPSTLNPTVEYVDTVDRPVSRKVQNMYTRYEDSNFGYPSNTDVSEILHLSLIDNILEMEEKILSGCLGRLKVKDREQWRQNLMERKYDMLDKTLVKRDDKEKDQLKSVISSEEKSSRPNTPDSYRDPGRYLGVTVDQDSESDDDSVNINASNEQLTSVKALSIALAQVSRGIEIRHIRKPLGHGDVNPKKKEKEEYDVIDRWEQSLLASTSYSQIFLHYCTLDSCIMWSRSVLLARCRICHRQRDPENMLLCDECNKGHHMYCLKPKLTSIPEGNWYCYKCKPREKAKPRTSRRTRKLFTEDSESEEEEEELEQDEKEEKLDKSANLSMTEVCHECGSGGHVICCDFCPKVFHLECTQPPLRRVPRGEWKCHKCHKRKSNSTNNHKDKEKEKDTVDNQTGSKYNTADMAQHDGGYNRRRCATKARHKIHGFVQSLRRNSVESNSSDDTPLNRRSYRRGHGSKGGSELIDDELPLHNAALQELLADVIKHKDSWPFTKPVTRLEVPDYYDVITKPMDFGKIKYKLNMGEYRCDSEVLDDVALVFDNCNTYNTSDAPVFKCGYRLLKYFEKRCRDLGFYFPENLMDGDDDKKVKKEVKKEEEEQEEEENDVEMDDENDEDESENGNENGNDEEDEDGPTKPKRPRHN